MFFGFKVWLFDRRRRKGFNVKRIFVLPLTERTFGNFCSDGILAIVKIEASDENRYNFHRTLSVFLRILLLENDGFGIAFHNDFYQSVFRQAFHGRVPFLSAQTGLGFQSVQSE